MAGFCFWVVCSLTFTQKCSSSELVTNFFNLNPASASRISGKAHKYTPHRLSWGWRHQHRPRKEICPWTRDWSLGTSTCGVWWGRSGFMAFHTKIGWILSGLVDRQEVSVNLTFTATHTLKIDNHLVERNLDDQLKWFLELESLDIMTDEPSVYEKFVRQTSFDGKKYQISFPWKEHSTIPDNFELCCRWLDSLLRGLRQITKFLAECDSIIRDQMSRGMIDNPSSSKHDWFHYFLTTVWYDKIR